MVMAANHDPAGTWDAMVDYAMMSRNVRALHVAVSLRQARRLQGARLLRRGRHRHGAVLGPAGDRRRREDRLPAGAGVGSADDRDVGPPRWGRSAPSGCCSPATVSRARRRWSGAWRSRRPRTQQLDERTEILLERIVGVPINQLRMMKLLVNQTLYAAGPAHDADARHDPRRDRAPHRGGLRLPAARRCRHGLPRGGARTRRALRRPRRLDVQRVEPNATTARTFKGGVRTRLQHLDVQGVGAEPERTAASPGNSIRTPVNSSETSHSRAATCSSRAARLGDTGRGWPRNSPIPSGPT